MDTQARLLSVKAYLNAPSFNPILLDLPGPLALTWYSLMYFLGFLFTYHFVSYHIRKRRIIMTSAEFSNIITMAFLGVIIGGRLGFVLFVHPVYYFSNPMKILSIWEGGMYFFGGLILAMLLPWLYVRRTKLNYLDVADLFIVPVPIALAFGRWGNFMNGEFWGKPSRAPWAMVFDSVPDSDRFSGSEGWVASWAAEIGMDSSGLVNLPRHPAQLYELLFEGILLFIVLLLFRNISRPRGSVLSMFFLIYGALRFWIEFYRHPVSQSALILNSSWFTLGMLFSIPMVIGGALGLFLSFKFGIKNELYKIPKQRG